MKKPTTSRGRPTSNESELLEALEGAAFLLASQLAALDHIADIRLPILRIEVGNKLEPTESEVRLARHKGVSALKVLRTLTDKLKDQRTA